nr:hypothetical protein [Tanacetum cinerariifolium]
MCSLTEEIEGSFTICEENKIFQDFLNTSESSNDNTNIVSAPQEPFVFNLDPGENSSQSPPHIDHHCCYGCGDSLDSIFFHQCTCESCRNGAHYGYNCPPKVPIISNPKPCHNQTLMSSHKLCQVFIRHAVLEMKIHSKFNSFSFLKTPKVLLLAWDRVFEIKDAVGNKQYKLEDIQELIPKLFNDVQNIHEELAEYINTPSWNHPAFYNYDDDDNDEDYTIAITPVLSIEDPSSLEDLVPIPSESEGIPDDTCDVPFRDNSPPLDILKDQFKDFFDSNDDSTLIDDDSFSIEEFDYKPDTSLSYSNNSLLEFETFSDHTKETSSGSTTAHADNSLPKYDLFIFEIEPDQGELTSVVMEDNLGEPRVHVPNVLPTHPTLYLDSNFTPSDNSLPESEIFCFDIKEKNSGSTTIHADISLSNLDHFHFKIELDLGDLTSIIDPEIRKNISSMTNVKLPFKDDQSPLFTYVVWIFLSFLTYPVAPPYLLSFGNEYTIFHPGISIYHSFMPGVSHRSGTFMKFNVYLNHLNESPMEILSSTCSPMEQRIRGLGQAK